MEQGLISQLVLLLAAGAVLVAACQRLGLSPILGYLAAGVLAGPAVFGWLADGPVTHTLAEIGVVLLMFTIGLEFSLPRLLAAKRLVFGVGGAQVVLTSLIFGLIGIWFGLPVAQALILGAALAMSSTAIVLKQLGEQMELPAPHGRAVTGVLLFQDIAAVPILVVLPILAGGSEQLLGALSWALLKAALVFVGLVVVGRRLLPPVLHWVAQTRSLELFMLTSLLLAMAAAEVSALAGLSPTLGAFMAGMLLGETLFRHQIEADIRPFRDLMLGLFFVTIGMQLEPQALLTSPGMVALVLCALVLGKALIIQPVVRWFGDTPRDAWRAAIGLAQGGEFGLLVVSSGLALGLYSASLAQPVLGGLILSMVLAPLLLRFNERIAGWLSGSGGPVLPEDPVAQIEAQGGDYEGHVIVCGYGRLGQNLVSVLTAEGITALALDLDPERVSQAAAAGEPVLYGNVSQTGVLHAAGIERARALAFTIDDAELAERIVHQIRGVGLQLPILVRSRQGRDEEALIEAGAEVFPEGLETSLAYAGQLLIMLDVPPSEVEAHLNEIRAEDYAPLRVFFHATDETAEAAADYPEQVRTLVVTEGHFAAGRTPEELDLPACGVELLDVRRGALRLPGRLLDTRLRAGDVLLLKGERAALDQAVRCLLSGP